MSNFKNDIRQEQILNIYLDKIYREKGFKFRRIFDKNLQFNGIDLLIELGEKEFKVDEKAQLHYLNKDLPTFTFELSYFNSHDQLRKGWLLDPNKETDFYFLVTGIILKNEIKDLSGLNDISKLKITSVNRKKLFQLLIERNLNPDQLQFYDESIRYKNYIGKNFIDELDGKTEGHIHYTGHLSEKPMNLQLRLKFLIEKGIAKRLYS